MRTHPKIIPLLLTAGADPNVLTEEGESPLFRVALHESDLDAIGALLQAGADPHAVDSEGWTPLHAASHKETGQFPQAAEIVSRLLSAGADPNQFDIEGYSPLDLAYTSANGEIVRRLRQAGAQLHYPVEGNAEQDVVLAAFLILAVLEGDTTAVDSWIAAGRSIDARDRNGITPLDAAACAGNAAMVAHLLAYGADVNVRFDAKDDEGIICPSTGDTPLHGAAVQGHPEVARLLVRAGADIEALGGPNKNMTPLMAAVLGVSVTWQRRSSADAVETVRVLIEEGKANVHARCPVSKQPWESGYFPKAPLNIAAYWGYPSTVELLLSYGAGDNRPDLLDAMENAVGDNGFRNLPTLWGAGQRLTPPLRLLEVLPHIDESGLHILLNEAVKVDVNEPDPVTGETPLHWVERHISVLPKRCFWSEEFAYTREILDYIRDHHTP